jgi:uncharacterized protein YbbC (DUF1343 family)
VLPGQALGAGRGEQAPRVWLGIDVLEADEFKVLKGQRVGLLSHPAGVNRHGVPTWHVMHESAEVDLRALFGPEHGLDGKAKANAYVPSAVHTPTGLPVHSLYGPTRKPTPEMLSGLDVLVVDLQDIGTRSYTYISAMKLAMEACFEAGKAVVVLDRPNPLGGLKVDGPVLQRRWKSYVGAFPLPYVHGLTIGELARAAVTEPDWLELSPRARSQARLTVVPMRGWHRQMLWPHTGLKWVPTSPAIPDFAAAVGYPITGLGCQIGGFTHGYGGPWPFRLLRHPGVPPEQLTQRLNALRLPGLSFRTLKPTGGAKGSYIIVDDWGALKPTQLSFHLMRMAAEIASENPFHEAAGGTLFNKHVGSTALWEALSQQGVQVQVEAFLRQWDEQAERFKQHMQRYHLYQ